MNTSRGRSKSDGVYGYAAWITTLLAPSSLTARTARRAYNVIDWPAALDEDRQ